MLFRFQNISMWFWTICIVIEDLLYYLVVVYRIADQFLWNFTKLLNRFHRFAYKIFGLAYPHRKILATPAALIVRWLESATVLETDKREEALLLLYSSKEEQRASFLDLVGNLDLLHQLVQHKRWFRNLRRGRRQGQK